MRMRELLEWRSLLGGSRRQSSRSMTQIDPQQASTTDRSRAGQRNPSGKSDGPKTK